MRARLARERGTRLAGKSRNLAAYSKTRPLLSAIPRGFPRMPTTLAGGRPKILWRKEPFGNLSAKMASPILMIKALTIVYQEGVATGTRYSTILRLLAALRILLFPQGVLQFRSMEILKKLYNPGARMILCIFSRTITIFRNTSHCGSECSPR